VGAVHAAFEAARHPRGGHGKFVHVSVTANPELPRHEKPTRIGNMVRSTAPERRRKTAIQRGTELARGVRQPRDFREADSLNFQSPRARAKAFAETGSYQRSRSENIRSAANEAKGFTSRNRTVGVKTTFTGQKRRVRGVLPGFDVRRPTSIGAAGLKRFNDFGDPRVKLRPTALTASAVHGELKAIRGRRNLERFASAHGIALPTSSAILTDAAMRHRIADALGKR